MIFIRISSVTWWKTINETIFLEIEANKWLSFTEKNEFDQIKIYIQKCCSIDVQCLFRFWYKNLQLSTYFDVHNHAVEFLMMIFLSENYFTRQYQIFSSNCRECFLSLFVAKYYSSQVLHNNKYIFSDAISRIIIDFY